jgi:hypothetical protein
VAEWFLLLLANFIIYAGVDWGITLYLEKILQICDGLENIVLVQMLYLSITIMNIINYAVPLIFVIIGTNLIYKANRNTKIFIPILFMLITLFSSQFFAALTQIPFSPGNDGYSRDNPSYVIRIIINVFWLAVIFFIYWKFFRKKFMELLESAEEQICHMIGVPLWSYIAVAFVILTLITYGISLMTVDPGSFLIAIIVIISMMIICFLMYWAIFKVVIISAGSAKAKAELDVASKIQVSALPAKFPAFPERTDFDIYASMNPAKEVGGDFYDFFLVDENHLAVLIADVSGKGVPAALFMMSGRAIIHNQAMLGIEPGKIFQNANNQLAQNNEEGMFITAFLGILDLTTGDMDFCNAGHNLPYICKTDGSVEPLKMKPGFVLAGMEGMRYKTDHVSFQPKEKLVLYTDGVTEAINPAVEMYTETRLEEVLKNSQNKTTKDVVDEINASVYEFADTAEQFDDITILVVERT